MSLIVETGAGVEGAESYATVAFIDAYWLARTHDPRSVTWAAATTPKKEGAAREASAFMDATWGSQYRGTRRGYVQGLEFPRTEANDDAGFPLPDHPAQLMTAVAELSPKALAGPLAPDVKAGGGVIERVKASSVEVQFAVNGSTEKAYPAVARLLTPLLRADSAYYFGVAGGA